MTLPLIRCTLAVVLASALAPQLAAETLRVPQDHTTIQAAVDAASPGDVVLVSKGTYNEQVSLVDRSGLTLRAKGKVIVEPPLFEGILLTGIDLSECVGIVVDGFTVRGFSVGVEVVGSTDFALRDLFLDGNTGRGLELRGVARAVISGTRVRDSAVALDLDDSTEVVVEGCDLRVLPMAVMGAVLTITKSTDLSIAENRLRNGGSGVRTDTDCARVDITDNDIRDSAAAGLDLAGADLVVRGNVLRHCEAGVQVLVDPANTSHLFADNRLLACATFGFDVGADGTQLRGNLVKGAGTDALVSRAANALILGNRLFGSGANGLRVLEDPALVRANRFKKNAGGDLELSAANVYLIDNMPPTDAEG